VTFSEFAVDMSVIVARTILMSEALLTNGGMPRNCLLEQMTILSILIAISRKELLFYANPLPLLSNLNKINFACGRESIYYFKINFGKNLKMQMLKICKKKKNVLLSFGTIVFNVGWINFFKNLMV
jgi:hypothetical protein